MNRNMSPLSSVGKNEWMHGILGSGRENVANYSKMGGVVWSMAGPAVVGAAAKGLLCATAPVCFKGDRS